MAHIPTAATGEIALLTFAEAMRKYGEGEKNYDTARWLYVPDFYTEYRYILGTKGKNPLIAVGINPSTAAPDDLDNTLKSVERIALANGYDSFIMFNVYAQRATDPKHMEKTFNETLHRENMAAFEYILSLSERPAVWAACNVLKGDVKVSAFPFRTHYVPRQPYYDQWKAVCQTGRHEWMNHYLK